MNRKWLVTGASGFLGGRLLQDLSQLFPDDSFKGTSRSTGREKEFNNLGIDYAAGDLSDRNFCEEITQGMDIIIHCAALSSAWGPYDDFYKANVTASENLLAAARKNRTSKFIYISTAGVYQNGRHIFNTKEDCDETSKPINHYVSTKHAAEKLILNENSEELQTISLRPRVIVGAGDTVVFPRLIRAYNENKLSIIGDGENVINTSSVENIVESIRCALDAPLNKWGEAYNITDGKDIKLWVFINEILCELGYAPITKKIPFFLAYGIAWLLEKHAKYFNNNKEPVLLRYSTIVVSKSFTVSIDKAKRELGFEPVTTPEETLKRFTDWYKTTVSQG